MHQPVTILTYLKLAFIAGLLIGCHNPSSPTRGTTAEGSHELFTLLPPEKTNVTFSNTLTEGLNTNVLLYEYFYNGGGVAVGDINGDGLQDLYFSGNMSNNKLYLNKGHMQFEDITDAAAAGGRPGPWKTGVTMVDINGDGKTDIYLCYSGKLHGPKRQNQLFINEGNDRNGIPHFSEQAEQYGLADTSYSTQAFFFDYDRDGDLDMFLLNHNPNSLPVLDEAGTAGILSRESPMHGVRLYQNDNGHFKDVTKQAGLSSSALTYGLGAGIADINGDGWPDIYISNDYSVPDYLYINNHKGGFINKLSSSLGHTSQFSMGNNVSDINNDGLPDIFTLDMLPEDNHRQKLLLAPDNYEKFDITFRSGFYYQYMRNMLQLNNGDGSFSEIGQLAGISNTDWSWAPLFADYDNDGWKDLFITNGYLRDYTNMDFIRYMNDYTQSKGRLKREDVLDIIQHMPASDVISYMFKNNGNLTFTNTGTQWGIHLPSNSNGAVYADLDNDGDLDLVVNNVNQPAFIYRNEENTQLKNHYLELNIVGGALNTQGIGAKITIYTGNKKQYLEQMPARGFQSCVSPVLHFGLGAADAVIDSLRIIWQSGRQQLIQHVKADQLLTLQEKNAESTYTILPPPKQLFEEITSPVNSRNEANTINDFKRQPLMVNPLSFSGPCLAKADLNGDGLEDVYAGGGSGQPGVVFLQQKNGRFIAKPQKAFEVDKSKEDADAVFFDANGDGFPDLYVVSGGYHNYLPDDSLLQDRLYLNDGKANFIRSPDALPLMHVSKSCVRVSDINGDGYPDLFVGGRVIPGRYPETPRSFLLINDGRGHFTDQTASISPSLQKIGMVTDAVWMDLNGDKKNDLIVVGEWMPIFVFISTNGKLENKSKDYFDKAYSGWWNKLAVGDFNNDGRQDLVIGNMGLNTQCKVTDKEPAEMYYKDFDNNGSVDPILCYYIEGKSFPYVTRDELLNQISAMRTRFKDYRSYADATINDIFTTEELKNVNHLSADFLKTAYFERGSDGKFHEKELPLQAQFSPVYTITPLDYDGDGKQDLLLCGNSNRARLRFGKYDASYGVLLKGDGKGYFSYIGQQESGFHLRGDIRSVLNIGKKWLFGINQQQIKAYKIK